MRAFELILTETPQQISQIAQGVQQLSPNTNPRLLQKLQDLIDFAINGSGSAPKPKTPSTLRFCCHTTIKYRGQRRKKALSSNG